METLSGEIFTGLVLSVLLAGFAAVCLSRLYRRKIITLMSSGAAPNEAYSLREQAPVLQNPAGRSMTAAISPAANRAARARLAVTMITISLLVGTSVAWFLLTFEFDTEFGPEKLLMMGVIYAAPIVPVLGALWRWSWIRILLTTCGYVLIWASIVYLRSNENQSYIGVLAGFAPVVGLPLAAVLILAGSGKTRAAAPHLFPPFVLLTMASIVGIRVLTVAITSDYSGVIAGAARVFGSVGTFILFVVLPWTLAFWPIRALGRWLAKSYRNKRFSEVTYLFGGYWLISLLFYALPPFHLLGFFSFMVLAAWLWIPIGLWLARPMLVRTERAPVLLVLRVFQRDTEVEALFDLVIERWRASGPAVLIAGTDLASRTMDSDDLFTYLQGSLAQRFIRDEKMLHQELATMDTAPDSDGRYRVTDFYCFDSTWRAVLVALVSRADRVLMDVRGLTKNNAGCLFELETLASARHIKRIVLLCDSKTDRVAAERSLGGKRETDTIIWQDVPRLDSGEAEKILSLLLDVKAAATESDTGEARRVEACHRVPT